MDEANYSVQQACSALNVNPRTLRKWVTEQDMAFTTNRADNRIHQLTETQVRQLAAYYGREIQYAMQDDALTAIIGRLRALQWNLEATSDERNTWDVEYLDQTIQKLEVWAVQHDYLPSDGLPTPPR